MTVDEFISGLQNQYLRFPLKHLENVRRFTMTGQSDQSPNSKNRDDIPFARIVDVWWIALCIGIQEGNRTKVDSKEWHQFIRAGEVLPSNPWRVFQLQIMAIGETGNTDILSKPGEIVAMANEYAATGLPLLLSPAVGSEVPIWAITNFVESRINIQQ